MLPGGRVPLIVASSLSPFSSWVLRPQSCHLYQDACFDPCLLASQFISLHENGESGADGESGDSDSRRAVAELWLQHSLQRHCLSAQLRPLLGDRQYIRKFYTGTWSPLTQDPRTLFSNSSTLLFLERLTLPPGPDTFTWWNRDSNQKDASGLLLLVQNTVQLNAKVFPDSHRCKSIRTTTIYCEFPRCQSL